MQRALIPTKDSDNGGAFQSGFTLVETLVALSIIAIALLGLGGLVTATMQNNLQNEMRGEASRMMAETAAALRTQPLDMVVSGELAPYDETNLALNPDFNDFPAPNQTIRSGQRTFDVEWQVTAPSADLKEVSITVEYDLKGKTYTNSTTIYLSRGI